MRRTVEHLSSRKIWCTITTDAPLAYSIKPSVGNNRLSFKLKRSCRVRINKLP